METLSEAVAMDVITIRLTWLLVLLGAYAFLLLVAWLCAELHEKWRRAKRSD
jgi:hypothetical protein